MNSHKVVEKAICVEKFSTSLNSVLLGVKLILCCCCCWMFFIGPLSFPEPGVGGGGVAGMKGERSTLGGAGGTYRGR